VAITRAVPPSITSCELTHLERRRINFNRAVEQHAAYERALEDLGCSVVRLPATPDLPDSVFVEDTAVVLPELAIITHPGAPSRRPETKSVAEELHSRRPVAFIRDPGTMDGGDVLRVGKQIYVGNSSRTNMDGISQLAKIALPLGYTVRAVTVTGCLHLKSAVAEIADNTVLLNPAYVDPDLFSDLDRIEIDASEPDAANALRIGDSLIYPTAFPATGGLLAKHGFDVRSIDVSELQKAEAGVTCCSILV